MRLDYFVNLRYQTRTVILQLGITHSMRDVTCDVNYCTQSMSVRYGLYNACDESAVFCINSFLLNDEFHP